MALSAPLSTTVRPDGSCVHFCVIEVVAQTFGPGFATTMGDLDAETRLLAKRLESMMAAEAASRESLAAKCAELDAALKAANRELAELRARNLKLEAKLDALGGESAAAP